MSVEKSLNEDHEVLGSEFCSGYTDSLGRYVRGFYCPTADNTAAVFCCGGSTYKYCCTQREHHTEEVLGNIPLILGAVLGATAALCIIVLVSCCCCACCPLYKIRQKQANNGPVYRMQSSSTASGVANMYSFSNQNSLATTPIDSAASQILVELEPGGGGEGTMGTMGRGHTFSRDSSTRTLQRNGRAGSSPQLDRYRDPPPPYDASKPTAALHKPGAHHTLPHQRHHHHQYHHQQQQHHQQHQQHHQQHMQQHDSQQSRGHLTLPRSQHASLNSARSGRTTDVLPAAEGLRWRGHVFEPSSPITTYPHGSFNASTTATLSRGPRVAPVAVPVVGPHPPPQSQGVPLPRPMSSHKSPVTSPTHGTFQTHTLRHGHGSSAPAYGMTHSTSSTFNPAPPPSQPPPVPHESGPDNGTTNGGPVPVAMNVCDMPVPPSDTLYRSTKF